MNPNIYAYHNGVEQVYADPIATFRQLYADCKELGQQFPQLYDAAFPLLDDGEQEDLAATCGPREILFPVICNVFGMKPFDRKSGEGVTIDHAEQVLLDFIAFMEKKSPLPEKSRT